MTWTGTHQKDRTLSFTLFVLDCDDARARVILLPRLRTYARHVSDFMLLLLLLLLRLTLLLLCSLLSVLLPLLLMCLLLLFLLLTLLLRMSCYCCGCPC